MGKAGMNSMGQQLHHAGHAQDGQGAGEEAVGMFPQM
jgi:hypothetical protein